MWVHLLGRAEEAHTVVGDEVCEVILAGREENGEELCIRTESPHEAGIQRGTKQILFCGADKSRGAGRQ